MVYYLRIISEPGFSEDSLVLVKNFVQAMNFKYNYGILESGDYYKMIGHKVASFELLCEMNFEFMVDFIGSNSVENNGYFAIFDNSKGSIINTEGAYWVCIEIGD
ncbi:MAG: hypothetical protein ACFCU1_14110 [Sumerlaeia bacterium]